jgi:hypothetical protein
MVHMQQHRLIYEDHHISTNYLISFSFCPNPVENMVYFLFPFFLLCKGSIFTCKCVTPPCVTIIGNIAERCTGSRCSCVLPYYCF